MAAMSDPDREPGGNPMNHPEEQPAGADGDPKFGRLLVVLLLVVAVIGLVTWASEKYLSYW
jgi:hypothetical protein